MRIPTLLQKIASLSEHPEYRTAIDVDLMLDYTRVLYADLLEWRSKLPATLQSSHMPVTEPTPDKLAEAMKEPGQNASAIPKKITDEPGFAARNTANTSASVSTTLKPQASSPADIRTLISINDKYQIMSELFGNDKVAYEEALTHINSEKDAETAIGWLRDRLWIAEEHGDAAQQFFEIVRRFKN